MKSVSWLLRYMAEALPPRPIISPVSSALLPDPFPPMTKFTCKNSQYLAHKIKMHVVSKTIAVSCLSQYNILFK